MNAFHLRILSSRETFFEGDVEAVSSKNSAGPFDILSTHSNFITVIENQPIVVRKKDKQTATFNFPIAVIHTKENQVTVYTGLASQGETLRS